MKTAIPGLLLLFFISLVYGQDQVSPAQLDSLKQTINSLEKTVKELKNEQEQEELQELRKAAREQSQKQEEDTDKLASKTFEEKSRALQALNPELSLTGDMLGHYLVEDPHYTDDVRSGFLFRVMDLHFQSNLDPFSLAKVIIEFGTEEIALAEAYITWVNPLPKINIMAGKFRQQFGVVNRWHQHALDQVWFPLPIQLYMGEEGLNQVGFSVNWLMPTVTAHSNELTVQITNSMNPNLFSGGDFGLPSTLVRFSNYYDLTPDTYFELGVTGLAGPNDDLGFTFAESHRWTYMAGLDLTLSWSPAGRSLYRGFTWRSELFYLDKELETSDNIQAFGGFSYLDYKISRGWILGVRGDIAQPPIPDNDDKFLWQVVPYVTFWQSEYVRLRFEFSHLDGHNLEQEDNRFTLQLDWAVGPHKHERY